MMTMTALQACFPKIDTSTSSLTKKLQKDAYKNIKDDADSVTENAAKFTDEKSTLLLMQKGPVIILQYMRISNL